MVVMLRRNSGGSSRHEEHQLPSTRISALSPLNGKFPRNEMCMLHNLGYGDLGLREFLTPSL
jgi:hypothetical protein